jgi:hypothetical protein
MGIFNDANLGFDGGNAGSVGYLRAQLFRALGDLPGSFGGFRRFADMGDAHGAILIDDRVGVGESMRATWFQVCRDQHTAAWMHGRRGFQERGQSHTLTYQTVMQRRQSGGGIPQRHIHT